MQKERNKLGTYLRGVAASENFHNAFGHGHVVAGNRECFCESYWSSASKQKDDGVQLHICLYFGVVGVVVGRLLLRLCCS
jgi:hypothetical protein